MAAEQVITGAERDQTVAALREAQKALDGALYQLTCGETVYPARIEDYVRDVERWCWHAKQHLGRAQNRLVIASLQQQTDDE